MTIMLGRTVEAGSENESIDKSKQRLIAKTEVTGNREDLVSAFLAILVVCTEVGFGTLNFSDAFKISALS